MMNRATVKRDDDLERSSFAAFLLDFSTVTKEQVLNLLENAQTALTVVDGA